TIRWSPFKWPFRDSSMLIGVSSYSEISIHTGNTVVVEGGVSVRYRAPEIILSPGFSIEAAGEFAVVAEPVSCKP
uniref:hypothetical protein n=2 Tax=Thiolapillus sp. TaxID=2017437 RepID=UPI003AF836BC